MKLRNRAQRIQGRSPLRSLGVAARQPMSGTLSITTPSGTTCTYMFIAGQQVSAAGSEGARPDNEDNIDGRTCIGQVEGTNGEDLYNFSGGFADFVVAGPIRLEIDGTRYSSDELAGTAPAAPCEEDADCAGDRLCENGSCTLPPGCTNDAECAGDRLCEGGSCAPPTGCRHDTQCVGDKVCQDGSCVLVGCASNADCSGDRVCRDGSCGPPPEGGDGGMPGGTVSIFGTEVPVLVLVALLVAGLAALGDGGDTTVRTGGGTNA